MSHLERIQDNHTLLRAVEVKRSLHRLKAKLTKLQDRKVEKDVRIYGATFV
jgi:hypothetical protein